ncbi:MAG: beta-galactosidase, partial [Candidatus Nealsonbacteria bacterium]
RKTNQISNGVKNIFKKILFGLLVFLLIFIGYFSIGSPPESEKISWGVNFSQSQADYLGLDWQEAYLALLKDANVKKIKLITNWNHIEQRQGEYNFNDLDWQIKKAKEYGAEIFLVIGMKTPRWPECHIPEWAENLNKQEQQDKVLILVEKIVSKYQNEDSIVMWQVENEPFFPFGECPWVDKEFLQKEIDSVRSSDPQRRTVAISDSGEWSFWITAASFGDKVATTLHRKIWFEELKTYISYPLNPVFYWRRAQIIKKFFDKEVIGGELQSEPWCPAGLLECSLQEQKKTMDLEQFRENIEFAQKTGLNEFYLWGAEWWYWMKETQRQPEIWNEAKKLFTLYE